MKVHLVSTSQVLNMFAVTCKGHDGETYILSTLFATRGMAEAKAELVRLRGSINPEHWVPLTKSKKAVNIRTLFSKFKSRVVAAEQPKAA